MNRISVEKAIVNTFLDLKEIVVIDSIEPVEADGSLRVRTHDLYGLLPEFIVKVDLTDRLAILDRLGLKQQNCVSSP